METKQGLQNKLDRQNCKNEEREKSNKLYAVKLVEKIVFGFLMMVLTAFSAYLISLVIGSGK